MADTTRTARIVRELDRLFAGESDRIERWFGERFAATPAPAACASVDLRHSGLKLAPVAADVFPVGFRTLSPDGRGRAAAAFRGFLAARCPPGATKVLLIPGDRTRNPAHVDDLDALRAVLEAAGAEVRLGAVAAAEGAAGAPVAAPTGGRELVVQPLERRGDRVAIADDGFEPDLIVVSDDPGAGAPAAILEGLGQPVAPPLALGWHRRRKSAHLAAYDALAGEFAAALGLDPWLITTRWFACGRVNFRERLGLECVARGVDEVVAATRAKYRKHGVADAEPYALIKADGGTYGVGVMTVRSGDEVMTMHRRRRHGMHAPKGGLLNAEVVIQEGVPTVDLIGRAAAEPVVYLVGGEPVGGGYRLHHARGEYDSLSAAGAGFGAMREEVDPGLEPGDGSGGAAANFRVFGALARLAALAVAREAAAPAAPATG